MKQLVFASYIFVCCGVFAILIVAYFQRTPTDAIVKAGVYLIIASFLVFMIGFGFLLYHEIFIKS